MTQKSIVTLALLLSAACSSDAPKSEKGPIDGGLIINEMMADNSWTLTSSKPEPIKI